MDRLEDCTAVVTGAASGIGLAITEAFVAEGIRVVMADISEDALTTHAARIATDLDADVITVLTDVRDPDAVERLGQTAVDHFGQLNIAVNNAGIVAGGKSWELPLEDWHRVMDVNLWGVIHGVRAFLPHILANGEPGHVVNTASMAAVYAPAGIGPYAVAKHGILALSDVLRAELESIGAPVSVSVVMPGMILTGMNPIGTIAATTVANNVVDAIRRDRAYVFTDDHHSEVVEARLKAILAARADVVG